MRNLIRFYMFGENKSYFVPMNWDEEFQTLETSSSS